MVDRIGRRKPRRIFPKEWREHRDLTLEQVAGRVGVNKNTIWRWEDTPTRLDPEKMASLAHALDIEPEDLWHPPPQRSIDAILSGATKEVRDTALEIVTSLVKRAS